MKPDRLFIGCFPCGISYADRAIEEHGDYKRVAFLPFSTLVLEVYCARSPLLPAIQEDARLMQSKRGERYQVSTCGQTVLLGGQEGIEAGGLAGGKAEVTK